MENKYICWGQVFESLEEISKDARCQMSLRGLTRRMERGWGLEESASVPPLKNNRAGWHKEVMCWGQVFPSILALSRDARCEVTYCQVTRNLARGLVAEEAILKRTGPPKRRSRKKFRSE
jgi:hypothetical protein